MNNFKATLARAAEYSAQVELDYRTNQDSKVFDTKKSWKEMVEEGKQGSVWQVIQYPEYQIRTRVKVAVQ